MFLARLDEAKESADRDMYRCSPNKVKVNKHCADTVDDKEFAEDITILEKCSEYLFDLFDANLTPQYRRIDLIQEKAIKCFDVSLANETMGKSSITEYTFEQEKIHGEFKDLFEQLISDFLLIAVV